MSKKSLFNTSDFIDLIVQCQIEIDRQEVEDILAVLSYLGLKESKRAEAAMIIEGILKSFNKLHRLMLNK